MMEIKMPATCDLCSDQRMTSYRHPLNRNENSYSPDVFIDSETTSYITMITSYIIPLFPKVTLLHSPTNAFEKILDNWRCLNANWNIEPPSTFHPSRTVHFRNCVIIKINLNYYFHIFSWCLKSFYEGLKDLHKNFWGTTKNCENKNLSQFCSLRLELDRRGQCYWVLRQWKGN